MLVITLKMMSIPAPPLFIEEVARSDGGVFEINDFLDSSIFILKKI